MKDDNDTGAISEVIGFVVVVSVVFIAIGLVFTSVIPILDDTEQAEQTKNAERVFSVLQENVEEMTKNGVPSRGTEIRLKDGRLTAMRDTSTINVTIESDAVPSGTPIERTIGTRHLTYETEAGVLSYENGAVFRRDSQGNSAMLERPDWRVKEDGPVIIPMVSLGGETEAVSGGVATILTTGAGFSAFGLDTANTTEAERVELEIESPNAAAWGRYAEDLEGAEVDSSSDNEVIVIIDDIDDRSLIYTENTILLRITQ